MKDLLNKEHYCYKIHTLLTKSGVYSPPSVENPSPSLYGLPPTILPGNCDPPFYDFSKISNPYK